MSVLIKDMEMPKECHGCRWFYFQGTSCTEPKYYLDARCELVESGQDWYGKDRRGGWVGESIEHIPGWTGSYAYKHCAEVGTRAKQCPLCELPSAQPEQPWIPCSERLPEHGGRYLISVLDGINRRTTVAPYMPRCKAWTMTGRMAYWKVIAWMPLPESYRG